MRRQESRRAPGGDPDDRVAGAGRSPMAGLLPPPVVLVEAEPGMWDGGLDPAEAAVVARAVDSRRRAFTAGRNCARRALLRLGEPAAVIPRGPGGAPTWPSGVVGSITHCAGYCAAAVAPASALAGLGIDAEVEAPLDAGVVALTSRPEERASLPAAGGWNWPLVLFSARESLYKAWFPLTGRWLDHLDVELTLDPSTASFSARLVPGSDAARAGMGPLLDRLEGRFARTEGHVLTAAWIPAARAGGGSHWRVHAPDGTTIEHRHHAVPGAGWILGRSG